MEEFLYILGCVFGYIWEWFIKNVQFLLGIIPIVVWFAGGRKLISKPRVVINENLTVGFEPTRTVYELLIYNKKPRGLQRILFVGKECSCWIEAVFIVGDDIPQLVSNKAAWAVWGGENIEEIINFPPSSMPYRIELINKISGELGFHIKTPNPESLMRVEDVLVIVTIRTGDNKILAMAVYALSDKGRQDWDIEFERLG